MKTILNVKTERTLKKRAKKVAHELGLSLSDVVNESLRQMVKTREAHFSAIPRMTPELEMFLGKIENDIKKDQEISPVFTSSKDMNEYLDSR